MASITWLHLSDWHQKGKDFDRQVVRDALLKDLRNRVKIAPSLAQVDFVVFSGDTAWTGNKDQYAAAQQYLLEPVLAALSVNNHRLFIVPGNHDLERDTVYTMLPTALQKPFTADEQVITWLTDDKKRARILEPFENYRNWVAGFTGQPSPDYASICQWEMNGKKIALLGINSALMCARNKDADDEVNDYGQLVVGEPQIHDALDQIANDEIRIAVMHHPFEWLSDFDRSHVEDRLERECHFILRGHDHTPKVKTINGTAGDCVIIPAGASYERRLAEEPRFTNAYNLVHLDFAMGQGTVYLRRWSDPRNAWIADHDCHEGGQFEFALPKPASDSNLKSLPAALKSDSVKKVVPPKPPQPGGISTQALQAYLEAVIADCQDLPLSGMDPNAADPSKGKVSLASVYIHLDTTTQVKVEDDKIAEKKSQNTLELEETRSLPALEALAGSPDQRMVLLGLPGTGKSTFARYTTLRMAQALKQRALKDRSINLAELLPGWSGGAVLPVIISLGRLAESLPKDCATGDASLVECYLQNTLQRAEATRAFAGEILSTIRDEGALVLFDGLDEIADLRLRPVVVRAIQGFAERYSRSRASRFLVTCRTYSYTDPAWQLSRWQTHELALLDDKKIEHFVDAWYNELAHIYPARAAVYADKKIKLQRALQPGDRRQLQAIARFPIILTMMAIVHTSGNELPDSRAEVYNKCIELLLERWEMLRPIAAGREEKTSLLNALGIPRTPLYRALGEIAYEAHRGQISSLVGDAVLETQVTEDLMLRYLHKYLGDLPKEQIFLEYCRSSNGLLMLSGAVTLAGAGVDSPPCRVYRFPHLTFEEYLAGQFLKGKAHLGDEIRALMDQSDRWKVVVELLCEDLCFTPPGDQLRMDAILNALAPQPLPKQMSDGGWRSLSLAGEMLLLYRRSFGQPGYDGVIQGGLRRLMEAGVLMSRERAAAADALDGLGWLPEDLYRFAAIKPSLPAVKQPFWIGLHPVTNLQYRRFLDAADFADPKLWLDFPRYDAACHLQKDTWGSAGWDWLREQLKHVGVALDGSRDLPRVWNDPRFGNARRGAPVVGVTWYEANAYCRWLQRHWEEQEEARQNPDIQPAAIRLPTEREWVLAAGGDEPTGRYPWDETGTATRAVDEVLRRANVKESLIKRTTPTGMYPLGRSRDYRLWDMAGNVWEWQANYYEKDRNWLALRGGSCWNKYTSARVSVRGLDHLSNSRYYDVGVRVVVVPS